MPPVAFAASGQRARENDNQDNEETFMNHGKILAIAGNQSTCKDLLFSLHEAGYRFAYLLHMGPEAAPVISDYHDLAGFAESLGIEVVRPSTYSMRTVSDRALFLDRPVDLLISAGWPWRPTSSLCGNLKEGHTDLPIG